MGQRVEASAGEADAYEQQQLPTGAAARRLVHAWESPPVAGLCKRGRGYQDLGKLVRVVWCCVRGGTESSRAQGLCGGRGLPAPRPCPEPAE